MTSDNSDNSADSSQIHKQSFFNFFKKILKKDNKEKYDARAYAKLDSSTKDMVRGVFHLADLNAGDIIVPRVDIVAIDENIDFQSLVKIARDAGHSRLPVFQDTIDNIVGIFYTKDLLQFFLTKSKKKFQIKKIIRESYFVPETIPLEELLLEFKKKKLHLAIVVDEYGGVAGIVTMEDILEEIVGEITDEFDIDVPPEFIKTGKNIYELDSRMTISDFNSTLNMELPVDEFDTIGGFTYDLFGKIPKKDDTAKFKNINFKIKEINGTIINRIEIKILSKK